MLRHSAVLLLFGLAPVGAPAQAPPGTDVFLAPIRLRAGRPVVGEAANLTHRPGYDNQPFFAPDGRSLFYTVIESDGQADIRRLDLVNRISASFTATPESEYSPTVMPGGREVAVVRVEADSTQRLWAFPIGGGSPRLLLERVKPVGYQAWLGPDRVAVFVLGSPPTLRLADTRTGEARMLLASIGRSLQRVPGKPVLSVLHQIEADRWYLSTVDPETAAVDHLVEMPKGAEYHVWLPDGSALTAAGNSFYHYRPGKDQAWVPLGEVTGVRGISRLALDPAGKHLAFVAEDSNR